jgi:hypothetical protein
MSDVGPPDRFDDISRPFMVGVRVEVVGGGTTHTSHDRGVGEIDLDPQPSEQKNTAESVSIAGEDNVLALKGFALWINCNVLVRSNANKNRDAISCQKVARKIGRD